MESVARLEDFQNTVGVNLVKVRAIKLIKIFDGTGAAPTFINPGEEFWVDLNPLPEGYKGLGAHFNGDSFYALSDQYELI